MKSDDQEVIKAVKAIDGLCLNCEKHVDTCYVAVAKRAISTIRKEESVKPKK